MLTGQWWALLLIIVCLVIQKGFANGVTYPWIECDLARETVQSRIPNPDGFQRVIVEDESFEDWLCHLPLKDADEPVRLFNGELKRNQNAHVAVVDIDIGERDLQQCADAIIRLRAEYLFSIGKYDHIRFTFTNGDTAAYSAWIRGVRPVVDGNDVSWLQLSGVDSSYAGFRSYLKTVFMYAGSYSLDKELIPVESVDSLRIGDVFIQGGFPGHAVIVVDMAEDPRTGKRYCLLAQSYMPAQDIHILKNPMNPELSPWYEIGGTSRLETPEWMFDWKDGKRFEELMIPLRLHYVPIRPCSWPVWLALRDKLLNDD